MALFWDIIRIVIAAVFAAVMGLFLLVVTVLLILLFGGLFVTVLLTVFGL